MRSPRGLGFTKALSNGGFGHRHQEQGFRRHGQVDGLLNVAGIIQRFVKLQELEFDEIERVMNVNFWGVVNMTKAFLPELLARPTAAVLTVSSMGGFLPVPGQAAYGASKAAVKLFTEALYAETRGTNLSVTVVFPGGVGTNITANSGVEMKMPEGGDAKGYTMTSPRMPGARSLRVSRMARSG